MKNDFRDWLICVILALAILALSQTARNLGFIRINARGVVGNIDLIEGVMEF